MLVARGESDRFYRQRRICRITNAHAAVKVKRVECVLPSRCAVEHTLNFTAALAQELDSCTSSICNVGGIDALERVVEDFAEIGNVSIFLVIRVIRPYGAPCAGLFLAPRGEDG
jgi:hypothetical protein